MKKLLFVLISGFTGLLLMAKSPEQHDEKVAISVKDTIIYGNKAQEIILKGATSKDTFLMSGDTFSIGDVFTEYNEESPN